MNEAETRAEDIDPALQAAGWGVVEGSRIRREYSISPGRIEGHGKGSKVLKADCVLEYRNTKLGGVAAKALDEELIDGDGGDSSPPRGSESAVGPPLPRPRLPPRDAGAKQLNTRSSRRFRPWRRSGARKSVRRSIDRGGGKRFSFAQTVGAG